MTKTIPDILRIAVAQLNPPVGDIAGTSPRRAMRAVKRPAMAPIW